MIELIPAIDLIDGKCVRLSQGDYAQKKVYDERPEEVAKAFEGAGVRRLHVVDLDGAKAQHIVNWRTLERIATQTSLEIDFGGGLKSDEDLKVAFECGAKMVTGGSIAVKNPQAFSNWLQKYGADRIILGADVRDGKLAISGWQEVTETELLPFLSEYAAKGVTKTICTDIGKDGMLQGPSVDLYTKILSAMPDLYVIASGGVSSVDDIVALEEAKVPAVIFGKAIYEGRIRLEDFKRFL
ncbi:MAG: 1-(5-phosphoribosyl)-5-[(5-phosphoribosylamino)methylideneamino]imidazole-4-carboxamide isomerase [Paludibacteraceae bacterium]|jgi:phosphoribosylformimino-5-aminoimidazole carboxamide ribotide isomerase|nr:1-(5-phosphoribosyl)-5-[(5-phosphoribosylamino)methylideneamino]imidazole-4-carboxamide isomerase [Paludibacteraceae bacterium]MCR5298433.1 1-(5-phosphoribosyl)-5-[(5-phosphoribosylamino)methylideneamino]imidazole-4-carboxamide isomerase [Paludibacteraceae bacterium]